MSTKILITGDTFLGGGRIKKEAEAGNIKSIFGDFCPVIEEADLAITNLESPVINEGTPIYKTGPNIKSSLSSLKVLKSVGFDLVTLANNHIMDYGSEGLESTFTECNNNAIEYVGAGRNLNEARVPYVFKDKNKSIAIINIAENEFGTTTGNDSGANPLNVVDNYNDIKIAKEKYDFVVVIVHGGHEHYSFPSPRMKKTYRFFVDAGADFVIGHHPHCISGYEIYNNSPIFYSIGNFIFDINNQNLSDWNYGYALLLEFDKSSIQFKIIPYIQNFKKVGLELLKDLELNSLNEKIKEMNLIIEDDLKLEAEFEKYIAKTRKLYMNYLEPHNIRGLRVLQRFKVLPSFLSRYKKSLLLNLLRCEAHRDVVLKNLER